jgi:hypothetical protein
VGRMIIIKSSPLLIIKQAKSANSCCCSPDGSKLYYQGYINGCNSLKDKILRYVIFATKLGDRLLHNYVEYCTQILFYVGPVNLDLNWLRSLRQKMMRGTVHTAETRLYTSSIHLSVRTLK